MHFVARDIFQDFKIKFKVLENRNKNSSFNSATEGSGVKKKEGEMKTVVLILSVIGVVFNTIYYIRFKSVMVRYNWLINKKDLSQWRTYVAQLLEEGYGVKEYWLHKPILLHEWRGYMEEVSSLTAYFMAGLISAVFLGCFVLFPQMSPIWFFGIICAGMSYIIMLG